MSDPTPQAEPHPRASASVPPAKPNGHAAVEPVPAAPDPAAAAAPSIANTDNFFADLKTRRLPQHMDALPKTHEVLVCVDVRKPKRHEFIRVHTDHEMTFPAFFYKDEEEGEVFYVTPAMAAEMAGDARPALLVTAINLGGEPFLWPLWLPDSSGRSNAWWDTAREGAEKAKQNWIRITSEPKEPGRKPSHYRILQAQGPYPEPEWPKITINELLNLAFRDRIISTPDHPVIRRLRGLT